MYTFEVSVDGRLKLSIQADYYKERFNRDIIFYQRQQKHWWQRNRDVKVGMLEFPMIGHLIIKRL